MKRILPFILIIAALTGCTRRSKTEYITIEGDDLIRSTDSCEYFNVQWALFGRGNYSELRGKEINASFCSTAFYSKDISMGPILPIIPLFGSATHERSCKKWLKIQNLSQQSQLKFIGLFSGEKLITEIECYTTRYPGTLQDEKERSLIQNQEIIISPGEHIWINVPLQEGVTLLLESNGETHKFKVVKSTGYSWWMVTV